MKEIKRIFNGKERTYLEYTKEELEQIEQNQESQIRRVLDKESEN